MPSLYPLKFSPIFKDKLWGGHQIKTVLGQDYSPLRNCGELWAMSGVPENDSVVVNGFLEGNTLSEVVEIYMDELLGERVYERYGEIFPVLVKFIDTRDWLSVQVHPDDEMAQKIHEEPFGKTEMWYVLEAGHDAELISGFEKETTREKFQEALNQKKLTELLHFEKVEKGDLYFIPAGRIHAIGPDILLTEIQQTSDLTYRVYDWDRIDVNGLPRDLHMRLGLEALDYGGVKSAKTSYVKNENRPSDLIDCPAFHTNIIDLKKALRLNYSELDSFVILVCTKGSLLVNSSEGKEVLHAGEAILIPAVLEEIGLVPEGEAELLEVSIPD